MQLVVDRLGLKDAMTEEVKKSKKHYRKLLRKHQSEFSAEIEEILEANPGGQEDDNRQQGK